MTEQVKAQYEPEWYCPGCGNFECLTNDRIGVNITHNGDTLDVICSCKKQYEVIL